MIQALSMSMWPALCILVAMSAIVAMEVNPRQRKRAALIEAIRENDLDAVKRIVDSKPNLNFNYTWQFTRLGSPLSHAFRGKDRLIADILISKGASLSPNSPGNEALLSRAVHGGNFELIELALAAGHDIHFQGQSCSKPLATAIHHNSVTMARFLISKGANKDDLTLGDCRWHTMRAETILLVRELGIEVPQDVLNAVEKGEWDRRAPKQNI